MRNLPNLAARPFVNDRPVRRLIGVLWGVAVLLLLFNAYRYWRYATTNVEGRDQLQSIRDETDQELETIDELRTRLAGFDLRSQNDEIDFLNRRIAERSFPWSELFEQLGDVLPRGVRVRSLAPQLPEPQRQRRRRRPAEETRVTLAIDGTAEDGEALLDFVDRLFAHPAFAQPLLERESRQNDSLINFNLETYYRPRLQAAEEEAEAPEELVAETASNADEVAAGAANSVASSRVESAEPALDTADDAPRDTADDRSPNASTDRSPNASTVAGRDAEVRQSRRIPEAAAESRSGVRSLSPGSRDLPTPREDAAVPRRSRSNASSPPGGAR